MHANDGLAGVMSHNFESNSKFPDVPILRDTIIFILAIDCMLCQNLLFLLRTVEPLAFPMAHLQETVRHNSNSFVSHVYGAPLGDLNACIKIQGLSQNRTCTGRVSSDINMTKTIGDFGTATAHFSWSHGHVDRGNVFGKATWVLTQAADGSNLPQELFPRASFILRIRNSYFGRRAKKFVFTLDDIKENPHDHVRLQGE